MHTSVFALSICKTVLSLLFLFFIGIALQAQNRKIPKVIQSEIPEIDCNDDHLAESIAFHSNLECDLESFIFILTVLISGVKSIVLIGR